MKEILEMRRRLYEVAALMSAVLLTGTTGYVWLSKCSVFDGLYMTVITLATVGYGETVPLDQAGRAFTILLILGGIGVMTYAFTSLTSIVVEGHLSVVLRRRRMEKEIAKLTGHYIVCGADHSGGVISAELHRTGRPFVVIDRDPETVQRLADRLGAERMLHVIGDATADETLKAAGVERAAGVFAVLATDQDNAFVALSAKGLNASLRVVSRQKELGVREKLFRSGADNVVNPSYIGGLRMASEMIRPATVGFLDSMMRDKGSSFRFEEIDVPQGSPFVGRRLSELKDAGAAGTLLVAVLDPETGKYEINPDCKRPIKAGDALVMLGEAPRLADLRDRMRS
ncbi:MAG: NAD-binding protein [Elusimicrobia bacterium]|nr:NAD-binding protein [Elusimicrobiota bacterium]